MRETSNGVMQYFCEGNHYTDPCECCLVPGFEPGFCGECTNTYWAATSISTAWRNWQSSNKRERARVLKYADNIFRRSIGRRPVSLRISTLAVEWKYCDNVECTGIVYKDSTICSECADCESEDESEC